MSVKTDAEFDYEIVNKKVLPIAEALIKKYDELHHIDPEKILFVVNHKSAGSRKKIVLARTARVPEKWCELFYQIGSKSYFYMIEFISKTTAAMDESQQLAVIYRELRKIGPEGEILTYDVQDWWQILMGLGRKWYYPDNSCPNLLDESIDWRKLMGTYYEEILHEPD